MFNITYKPTGSGAIGVFLEGKRTGEIRLLKEGWAYLPGGKLKWKGEQFPTLTQCKRSVEGIDPKPQGAKSE